VLHLGPANPRHKYNINNLPLTVSECYRDLGILITPSLDFTPHLQMLARNANIRSGILWKCFLSRKVDILVRAYTVYVRPIIESSSVAWICRTVAQCAIIERPQRRFTKLIFLKTGLTLVSYEKRLLFLGLETLQIHSLASFRAYTVLQD
jgi:hypothetical protein